MTKSHFASLVLGNGFLSLVKELIEKFAPLLTWNMVNINTALQNCLAKILVNSAFVFWRFALAMY